MAVEPSSGREPLEHLFKVLKETLSQESLPASPDGGDMEWVIERIQDSFDSRAG